MSSPQVPAQPPDASEATIVSTTPVAPSSPAPSAGTSPIEQCVDKGSFSLDLPELAYSRNPVFRPKGPPSKPGVGGKP
ncbi:hypothetical protein EI94DRAFT_1808518 [Lactarius quietus]|nr:hypothetical protein EI94DRAFT_1808518 [Lactarius quietus]